MMHSKSLRFPTAFSGVTVGKSGGGQPLPMVILTIVVLAMALTTVYDSVFADHNDSDGKQIWFKCTACNDVARYTIGELRKMQEPGQMGPMMGPIVLDCPKCGKHTLTQAVECPNCREVFIMQIDPAKGMFNDNCPKCGESYAKAWREKNQQTKRK